MKKPGRNEPCHCGSGKKYKNCCLDKDEIEAVAASKANDFSTQADDDFFYPEDEEDDDPDIIEADWTEDDANESGDDELNEDNDDDGSDETGVTTPTYVFEEDEDEDEDEDDDDEEDDDDDDEEEEEEDDDDETETDDPYPTISDDDEKLVDAWWEKYRNTDDLDAIQSHLNNFISSRPDLVENLGLEHEMLFELGGQYQREGRYDEYILFLINFRSRFPSAYARGAGYLDKDIIAWLIGQNRRDEIKDYLNYFIARPVKFYEQLDDLLEVMLATDVTDEVIPLLTQVAKPLTDSRSIFGAAATVQPLIATIFGRYIKADGTEEDIKQFLHDAEINLPFEIDAGPESVAPWLRTFHETIRPFTPWPTPLPVRAQERESMITAMTNNFMRFMHERIDVSWMSARYYGNALARFLAEYWKIASDKKNTYLFRYDRIASTAAALSSQGYFSSLTKHMTILNALHCFADYLQACGNLNAAHAEALQDTCKRIYEKTIKSSKQQDSESVCFARFPLFNFNTSER